MKLKYIIVQIVLALLCIGSADAGGANGGLNIDLPLTDEQMVTARLTLWRCFKYEPLVERWNPDFDLDPTLVYAVMAKESSCFPYLETSSVGLMQVTPAGWTTTRERLLDPSVNVYWGMRILWLTLHDEEHNPTGDLRTALAAYNCGWESLEEDRCIDGGGYDYADHILTVWLPLAERYDELGWGGFLP